VLTVVLLQHYRSLSYTVATISRPDGWSSGGALRRRTAARPLLMRRPVRAAANSATTPAAAASPRQRWRSATCDEYWHGTGLAQRGVRWYLKTYLLNFDAVTELDGHRGVIASVWASTPSRDSYQANRRRLRPVSRSAVLTPRRNSREVRVEPRRASIRWLTFLAPAIASGTAIAATAHRAIILGSMGILLNVVYGPVRDTRPPTVLIQRRLRPHSGWLGTWRVSVRHANR
jgi:hypothetical protein